MSISTTDIPGLGETTAAESSDYIILHRGGAPLGTKDKRIAIGNLFSAGAYEEWQGPPRSYDIDEKVTYGLKLWKSLINDNEGNVPTEGSAWAEVSGEASSAAG